MLAIWTAIPAQLRSALRVAFGAFIVWAVTDGAQLLLDSTLPVWLKGLLLAVVIPALRALDPSETQFGIGSTDE